MKQVAHADGFSSAHPVVLMVDRNVTLRESAAKSFDEAGFVVLEAGDATKAIIVLQMQCDRVHALFTSIRLLGEMNGLQLAFHVRAHWPEVGIVMASGLDAPCVAEMPANARFFPKPYDIDQVIEHIRRMALAANPEGRPRPRAG